MDLSSVGDPGSSTLVGICDEGASETASLESISGMAARALSKMACIVGLSSEDARPTALQRSATAALYDFWLSKACIYAAACYTCLILRLF